MRLAIKRSFLFISSLVLCLVLVPTIASAEPEASCDYEYASRNNVYFFDPCDDSCKVTQGSVTVLNGDDNREKIYNYLRNKGLSPEQAAGVTGNIQAESGFSATRQEDSKTFPDGGWGIVQWTDDRRVSGNPDTAIVDYLKLKHPDLMDKYYKAEFGGSVSQDKGFVADGVNPEDSDVLLLNQLDFLYKESTNRSIEPNVVQHIEGAAPGDNEWDTLKKQTTLEGASNLWLYNFERPSDADSKSTERISFGQTILDTYSVIGGNTSCDSTSGELRDKVVSIAETEYAKWVSGEMSPGESFLKYSYNIHGDWCAWFVSWVYKEAGYPVKDEEPQYYAGVTMLMNAAKAGGKLVWHQNDGSYTPRPGDIAIYGDDSDVFHTNLIISAESASSFVTIGGNEGGGEVGPGFKYRSSVKKSEGSYWPGKAYGFISPGE